MCAKFGCGPTVVSKKRGVQTDRQRKLQLYIVDALFTPVYVEPFIDYLLLYLQRYLKFSIFIAKIV